MASTHKFTILFIGWLVLITSLSLFSFSTAGVDDWNLPHMDKLVHGIFHFMIMVLGILAWHERYGQNGGWSKSLVLLFLFSLLYGLAIELLQFMLPTGRFADVMDVLANVTGALLGILLIQRGRSLINPSK